MSLRRAGDLIADSDQVRSRGGAVVRSAGMWRGKPGDQLASESGSGDSLSLFCISYE